MLIWLQKHTLNCEIKELVLFCFDTVLSPGRMDIDLGLFLTSSWQSKMMARKKHEGSVFLKKVTLCGKHLCGVEPQGAWVSYWEGHLKEVTQASLARKEPNSAQRQGWEGSVPGTERQAQWVPRWCRAISDLIENLPREEVACTCSSVHSPGCSGQGCSPHRTAGTDRGTGWAHAVPQDQQQGNEWLMNDCPCSNSLLI